ncbi:cobalt ECF transporter T component CbiQ [Mumia sp. Pv 4-285]|uniref:cobalt ECF transporter T component CbiQ n=1 Tax=Mumia qirimensis TaxID=3234852 RepID=UPI00351D2B46
MADDSHGHTLYFHTHSAVHRAAAHHKVAALVGFVLVVVATPREWVAAFAAYLAVLVVVIVVAHVPVGYIARRMVVEVPFVVFAVLMPFVAVGPRVDVAGLSLSEAGLWAAWGLLVKGTISVVASLTLAATTEPHQLPGALARLRVPAQLVQIVTFMVRYLDVVAAEMRRMRIARESRGFQSRSLSAWWVQARAVGALFVRAYDRGERVHLAMLARGYEGEGRR